MAPDTLIDIKRTGGAFVGGSKGTLSVIMCWADTALAQDGRVTANFITLENAVVFTRLPGEHGNENIGIAQVQMPKGKLARIVPVSQAISPVFAISGVRNR